MKDLQDSSAEDYQTKGRYPGFTAFKTHTDPSQALPGWVLLDVFRADGPSKGPDLNLDPPTYQGDHYKGYMSFGETGGSFPVFLFGFPEGSHITALDQARQEAEQVAKEATATANEEATARREAEEARARIEAEYDSCFKRRKELEARIESGEFHASKLSEQLGKVKAHLGEKVWNELFPIELIVKC